ncbi:histone deacetylase of the RPD3/HDA1 superfamily, partial [Thalictrum thalictroides]
NDLFPCRGKVGKVYKEEAGCDRVGGDKARGFNINVSLPKGNYSDVDYMKIWDEVLIPVTQEFSPDIIIISGGFDA